MKIDQRQQLLRIGAAVAVGLVALDRFVVTPGFRRFKEQTDRIHALQDSLNQGELLMEREDSLRSRWQSMSQTAGFADTSRAEDEVLKAVARWARESRLTLTSLTPRWRVAPEGHEAFECRAAAKGDLATVSAFLGLLERDPAPIRLEECDITALDDRGAQLTLGLRFSALRLPTEIEGQ